MCAALRARMHAGAIIKHTELELNTRINVESAEKCAHARERERESAKILCDYVSVRRSENARRYADCARARWAHKLRIEFAFFGSR